ncbi:MAG TPA: RNA polymerase sigma factor [Rudaea sp.]|jgi:RNA polymerase sigma-70 factor (ECF subfamily)|nr:RNA polymerase sigma factor [Rudaea sp.]
MQDPADIDFALVSARPKAMAALLRYFRDLDSAEEAFQEACLRALQSWPKNGPPRDPAAWLILVGRNAALDGKRRQQGHDALTDTIADDAASSWADRVDESDYRDDLLRLMFVCANPELPATQQIALALRTVSGLSVDQIARAFLVSASAMEQRITRAKRQIAAAGIGFETPGAPERAARLNAVMSMIYLIFNEGYASTPDTAALRGMLADEAIRLARLLLALFPADPELMGLLALLLLQHSRAAARFDADGQLVLLDDQDRRQWNRQMIDEGQILLEKAQRHRRAGSYQIQAAIAAMHARAAHAAETSWQEIDLLYQALEALQPSAVVTLNRAVAVSKLHGAEAALKMIEPLAEKLSGYFYFHGLRGALLKQLDRADDARDAFGRAIALAHSAAEANHIRQQLDQLTRESLAAENYFSN